MDRRVVGLVTWLLICPLLLAGCPTSLSGHTTVTKKARINDDSTFQEINLDLLGSRVLTKPDQETVITITVVSNTVLYVAETVEDAKDNDIRIQVAGRNAHSDDAIVMLQDMLLQSGGGGTYTTTWRGGLQQLVPNSGQLTPATWTVFAIRGSGAPAGLDAEVTVEFNYVPW
ncbi:MAG: hypothetical protein IPM13_12180 [Phycisphaerales bacterium]|nr:hypothetical protein [Phycisphaerales bacterium]